MIIRPSTLAGPSSFSLLLLLLLLCVAKTALADSAAREGNQWQNSGFVTSMAVSDSVQLLGASCWWATVHPAASVFEPRQGTSSYSGDVCHSLVADKQRKDTLWLSGKSGQSGLLVNLEVPGSDDDYGMVLSLQQGLEEQNSTRRRRTSIALDLADNYYQNPYQITGGIGPKTGVHPVHVATNSEHVYVLSLIGVENLDEYNVPQKEPVNDMFGFEINAYSKINMDDGSATVLVAKGEHQWNNEVRTDDTEDYAVVNAAGLLLLGDVLLVGGSTRGIGHGFGISNGYGDMNGFITKMDRHTGEILASLRISTQEGEATYLYGMCEVDHEYVYLTGSTTGSFENGSAVVTSNVTKAFLLRVKVSTLEIVDKMHFETVEGTPAVGIACTITEHGELVYIAGNVQGVMRGSQLSTSNGSGDIFVTQVNISSGQVDWMSQIGGPSDEALIPHGGVAVVQGGVLVAGNTRGSVYRASTDESEIEAFVAHVQSEDGSFPDTVSAVSNATESPTLGNATATPSDMGNITLAPTMTPQGNATESPFNITEAPFGNSTFSPTLSPAGNETETPVNGTEAAYGNNTFAPTMSPLVGNETETPVNETEVTTMAPTNETDFNATLSPAYDGNQTEVNATMAPTFVGNETYYNATVAPTFLGNETDFNATLAPTYTVNETDSNSTLAPTGSRKETDFNATLAPTYFGNETDFNATLAPTFIGNETDANETDLNATFAPTFFGNETEANETDFNATLAPTIVGNATDGNATLAPTINATESPTDVNATETPTINATESPTDGNATETPTFMNLTESPTLAPVGNDTVSLAPTYNSSDDDQATISPTPTVAPTVDLESESVDSEASRTPSEVPTLSPMETTPMPTPTQTLTKKSGPGQTVSYQFDKIEIRLIGAPPLTDAARQVFEEATANFYRSVYNAKSSRRRLVEDLGFSDLGLSDFETTIDYTGEAPDDTGNTLTYSQTVTFTGPSDQATDGTAKGIVAAPFLNEPSREKYQTLLSEGDEKFQTVTITDAPKFLVEPRNADQPQDGDDDKDSGSNLILFIVVAAVGAVICCGCCACGLLLYLRQDEASNGGDKGDLSQRFGQDYDEEMEQAPLEKGPSRFFQDEHIPEHNPGDGDDMSYAMSLAPGLATGASMDEIFANEGAGGLGPTAGFGRDFDHPEKRSRNMLNKHPLDDSGIDVSSDEDEDDNSSASGDSYNSHSSASRGRPRNEDDQAGDYFSDYASDEDTAFGRSLV